MSKYRITLEGKSYEIEVEFLDDSSVARGQSMQSSSQAVDATPRTDVRVIDSSASTVTHVSYDVVTSPMPGTVCAISAEPGDVLAKGQVVLVLEAMKMENEIVAPRNGTLGQLFVERGQTVAGGTQLFRMA